MALRKIEVTNNFALLFVFSIERDAQLLANRIALLKQEEQKTWKKIDDTKKRTNEILTLKKRNEDRIQKVSITPFDIHLVTRGNYLSVTSPFVAQYQSL